MTEAAPTPASVGIAEAAKKRLAARYAAERRFQWYGRAAIIIALSFLVILLGRILSQGLSTFSTHEITLQVYLDPARIDRSYLGGTNFDLMVSEAVLKAVGEQDDDLGLKSAEAGELASRDFGFRLLDQVKANPALIGTTVTMTGLVGTKADLYFKGEVERATPEAERQLNDRQLSWLDRLKADGRIRAGFNTGFFTHGDSTEAEQAGVLGAIIGSAMTLLVAAFLAIPIGVMAAVWLEEFAPKNRWTDLVEVNVNNLAAVPSIVYGLLGLAVFINWLHVPRSSPLVGGLVLALMALPTMIIATRSALKAVPPSVREAALGVGASKTQTVFHHVLPLSGPGIMTGAILSMSHALGETAPLLMIGMVISMTGLPQGFASAATVLPVQVFIWENASERGFHERTAAAIIVLLGFMIIMNGLAIYMRSRFERRW